MNRHVIGLLALTLLLAAAPLAARHSGDSDDIDPPILRLEGEAPVLEGDPGSAASEIFFRVRLRWPSPSPGAVVTLRYATEPGTALADVDYRTVSGRLSFVYPQSVLRIAVPVLGDLQQEGEESFRLRIFAAQGAEVAAASAEGTILDDETTGLEIGIAGGEPQTVLPGGQVLLEVRVTKGGRPVAGAAVSWDVRPDEARLAAPLSTTDGAGRAENRVTLSPLAEGEVRVSARLSDTSIPPALFVLRASPLDERCRHSERLPPEVRALCASQASFDFREIEPDEAAALGAVGLAGLRLQHRLIKDRMGAVRGGSEATGPRPASAFAVAGSVSGSRPVGEREAGFDYRLRCFTAGADKELPGGFLLGAAVAYTDGGADHLGSGGALDTTTLSLSVYAAYQAGLDAFHLEGIATWGRQQARAERVVDLNRRERRVARADPEGTVQALSLGGGSGVDLGPLRLEGYGYAHWAEVATDPYGERGAGDFDLALAEQRQRSLLAEAGVELLYRRAFATWGLAVYLDSSAVRELADDSRSVRFRFLRSADPQYSLALTTEPPDRGYFDFEVGLTAKLPGPWAAFVSLQREVQRDDLETRSALAGVLFQF